MADDSNKKRLRSTEWFGKPDRDSTVDRSWTRSLLVATLVAFPALTLSVKQSNNIVLYSLVLASLVLITCHSNPQRVSFRFILRRYWPLHLAMAGMAIAVLPQLLVAKEMPFSAFDVPLRVACFALLFYLFLYLRADDFKTLQWGLIASVVINLGVIYIATEGANERPAKVGFLGIIPFSNLATLMAFLALLSVHWSQRSSSLLTAFKIATAGLGVVVTFLSQSRGGWFALLLYLVIGFLVFARHNRRATWAAIATAVCLVVTAVISSQNIQTRIASVESDIASYLDGSNLDTSVGLRFQLWRSAWTIIQEHPLLGIGAREYRDAVTALAGRGLVTPVAATYPHCHNEILFATVRYGVFGFLGILATLLVPLIYFLRDVRHKDLEVRATAAMGVTFCLAIFTFGLTDVVLVWRGTATFYAFFVAVLFAHLVQRKHALR